MQWKFQNSFQVFLHSKFSIYSIVAERSELEKCLLFYSRFFNQFWESRFLCELAGSEKSEYSTHDSRRPYNTTCHRGENLKDDHIEISPVRVVINAVKAFAYALDSLQKELWPASGWNMRRNVTLRAATLVRTPQERLIPGSCCKRNHILQRQFRSQRLVWHYEFPNGKWDASVRSRGDLGRTKMSMT